MAKNVNHIIEYFKGHMEFIRFAVANGVCTILNYAAYLLLCGIWNMHYIAASILSYGIALSTSFYLNKTYVFHTKKRTFETAVSYLLFRAFMGIAANMVLYVLVEKARLGKSVSWFLMTGLSFVISFTVSKLIFRCKTEGSKMKKWEEKSRHL